MAEHVPSPAQVSEALVAPPGAAFSLASRPSRDEVLLADKRVAKASLKDDASSIDLLQDRLYAEGSRALLLVLQGMDTSGKSGTIKSVFRATSPLGLTVKAFKKPSAEEMARDYLWRVHKAVPRKGYVGIFDRSHYEDVLIAKVRNLAAPEAIDQRYDQINSFEKHLVQNGIVILKCMLNISCEEQGERLRDRVEKPHKRWKFNPGDLEDRALWPSFMDAYETMVQRCSTAHAPWHIIPSDSKTRRNALVARLVRGTLEAMNPVHPDPGYDPAEFDFS
jgi:PPK2 family polyphosphate:nucleotide phosphotransferase